jgi:hypothetical protein
MLTHVEMSFQMNFVVKLVELNLKAYGHTFPFIVAVNKGKNRNILLESPTIMDTKICRVREGMLLEDEEAEPNDTYVNVLLLRLKTDEDEASIPGIFKEIADKYEPEGLVYIQSCLYNEYPDPNSVSRDTMVQDPENINVIHMCYYLRGDPIARISIMPFINKGVKKSDIPKFEAPDVEEEKEYQILMSNCGWFVPYHKIEALMKYPYSESPCFEIK